MFEESDGVVNPGDEYANKVTSNKAIEHSDKAAKKCHRVTEEKLTQKTEVWSNHRSAFQDQPIGGHKDDQRKDGSEDKAQYVPAEPDHCPS